MKKTIIIAITFLVLSACAQPDKSNSSSKENPTAYKTPIETVEYFMQLTNEKHDVKGAVALMADDIKFVGPAAKCNNKQEYEALLTQFLPFHKGWKKHQTFERGSEVCFIEDIYVLTPQGNTITLSLAEWLKVKDGKITEHKVFYDPGEFNKAFAEKK